MEVQNLAQIKANYPNQWVLIGDPELRNPETNASFHSRLIQGVVLLYNKDKRELAYDSKRLAVTYNETICIYTGEIPQNRVFLL